MTTTEKIADDLGQIIFRIETNFSTYQRAASGDAATIARRDQCAVAITSDIEKLKTLKERLLVPNESSSGTVELKTL